MAKGKGEGAGRPRKELGTDLIATVESLAGLGLTQAEIADALPISERTLRARIADPDEEISAAYVRGRAQAKEAHSARHRDIAFGRLPSVPVAVQQKALEFRLKTQFGFDEAVTVRTPDMPTGINVTLVRPSTDDD